MDPVLLPMLFNVIDRLLTGPLPVTTDNLNFNKRMTKKRLAGIGRVLEDFGIGLRDNDSLVPGADLSKFVEYWEEADLSGINTFFYRYPPYETFMHFLKSEKSIVVPPMTNPEARHQIGEQLRKNKTGLTFVGIDTFKWWGMAVGQVYVSHTGNRRIYWGGENPSLDSFEKSVILHYNENRPIDGFVNVGQLADPVCRELTISFFQFEKLFVQLCSRRYGYTTATSLVRLPTNRSQVQTILPRSQVKQTNHPIEWIKKRFIEDGIFINGRSVKMVKYQSLKAPACQ